MVNITALTFPTICMALPAKVEINNYPHLKSLEMASDPNQEHKPIDILIGSDFYWQFMTGKIVKEGTGLVAIESKLGWILSRVVETKKSNIGHNANEVSVTNLVLQQEVGLLDKTHELVTQLQRFWETGTIGNS